MTHQLNHDQLVYRHHTVVPCVAPLGTISVDEAGSGPDVLFQLAIFGSGGRSSIFPKTEPERVSWSLSVRLPFVFFADLGILS